MAHSIRWALPNVLMVPRTPGVVREFNALSGLIGAHFHQDMDLEYDTIPPATVAYAPEASDTEKKQLVQDMHEFLNRYPNNPEEEFTRRWGFQFTPNEIDQTVPEFFDMVRAILADPESDQKFE